MFEFINYGVLLLSTSVAVVSYLMLQVDKRVGVTNMVLKINIVFLILLNLYLPYNSSQNAEINRVTFNNGDTLQCVVGNRFVRVSKDENWNVENLYFLKENMIVKTNLCVKI